MKFLSLLAKYAIEGTQILTGFQPYISAFNPKAGAITAAIEQRASDSLTLIGKVVADIQVAGISASLTNEQKLAAATSLVAKIIRESELFIGHDIDHAKIDQFNAAITGITSNFVEALNSLKTDNIKTA